MKVILTKYKDKVDINHCAKKKMTPLHYLASIDHKLRDGERMFLSSEEIKVNERETNYLLAPLHIAVLRKNIEIVKILLDNPQIDCNIQNKGKNTPLHFASLISSSNMGSEIFLAQIEVLKLLLQYSKKEVDAMVKNKDSQIPLQIFFSENFRLIQNPSPKNPNYKRFIYVIELFVQNKLNESIKEQLKQMFPKKIIDDSDILREKLLKK